MIPDMPSIRHGAVYEVFGHRMGKKQGSVQYPMSKNDKGRGAAPACDSRSNVRPEEELVHAIGMCIGCGIGCCPAAGASDCLTWGHSSW